ncbi:hypothetical protein [Chryseobacterium oryctis]|uniref:Tetratricopeptide repeat-containing protein n=1 Tax=Chryseobacterium oryctis TaxID=2952618 RepID=A0ABT3HM65_9FLAO|nr:hypothetical protein [Chryseobacterium oryctis]MCW3160834.1 hypothetical protein [Chryseobacterium oryctis]
MKNQLRLFFFLLSFSISYSQKLSPVEIDRLQNEDLYLQKGKIYEGIEHSKKTIQLSEKINYAKGKARGYIQIAQYLHNLGKYREEQQYLDKAEVLYPEYKDDPILSSSFFTAYGRNYYELGLIGKSNETYNKALREALKIKDNTQKRKCLHYIYGNMVTNFGILQNRDSSYYYIHKAYKNMPRVIEVTNLIDYFILQKNQDSAKFYLDRAEDLLKISPDMFDHIVFNYMSARYYQDKKEYKKAQTFYEKSLELSVKMKRPKNIMKNYRGLADVYNLQNNVYKANEYLHKYTKLKDSFAQNNLIALQTSEKKIVSDEKKQREASKRKMSYIWGGLLLATIIIISILSFLHYRKIRKKDLLLKESNNAILQKNNHVKELEQKINETFEEIIQLAKNNSPEFWGRFQEIYPEFRKRILEINPSLKTSELILCAYIYLGFNTKDIAQYTFKAVQTIKNNKYNLRKRLSISPQDNLTVWIRDRTNA